MSESDRPSTGDGGEMPRKKPPLMRSLGAFVGHLWQAARTDPEKKKEADGRVVTTRRDVAEETRETPQGPVVVRRTVIEEIEIPPGGDIYTERSDCHKSPPRADPNGAGGV